MAIIKLAEWLNSGESVGATWPPTDGDEARIQDYVRNQQIYDGDHVNALHDQDDLSRYGTYITCNVGGVIVRSVNDLLFGEELKLQFPEGTSGKQETRVMDIWERSGMQSMLYEFGIDTVVAGDGILQPLLEDSKAIIQPVNVITWYPDLDPDNTRKVYSHTFAWKREVGKGSAKKVYLRMIIHTPGKIENKLFLMNGAKLGPKVDLSVLYEPGTVPDVQETGIDELLPQHVPNARTARSFFGKSEFLGLDSMFSAVNAHLTQTHWQLSRHSDPILAMGEEQFNAVVSDGGTFDRHALDAVFFGPNGETPAYVTWDGRTADAIAYVNELIDKILFITETAKQLFGVEAGGGAESGRALKYRLIRTLAKVNRKRNAYNYAIPKLLELAQRLEGEKNPVVPTLLWPDGLPQDQIEEMEYLEARRQSRTITRVEMVSRLDEVTTAEAEAKIEAVDAEEQESTDADAAALNARLGRREVAPIEVKLGAKEMDMGE